MKPVSSPIIPFPTSSAGLPTLDMHLSSGGSDDDDESDDDNTEEIMENILSKLAQQNESDKRRKRKSNDQILQESVDSYKSQASRFINPIKSKVEEAKLTMDKLQTCLHEMQGHLRRVEKLDEDILLMKNAHMNKAEKVISQLRNLEIQAQQQFPDDMLKRTNEETTRMKQQLNSQMDLLRHKLKKINSKDNNKFMKMLQILSATATNEE